MTLGLRRVAAAFVRLKWHLLIGGFRGNVQERIQTALAVVVSLFVGLVGLFVLRAVGQGVASAGDIVVVLLAAGVLAIGVLSAAAGVETTIDPRRLATEPITRWELGIGMLAAATVGPGGVLALLIGVGILLGWGGGGPLGWVIAALAVLAWWVSLLLFSRSLANLLGSVASGRLRHLSQLLAAASGLLAWLAAQLVVRDLVNWDAARWRSLAEVAEWTPPGQLGRALATVDRPGTAVLHLVVGCSWLPLLLWVAVATTSRLAMAPPRAGAEGPRAASHPAGLRTGPLQLIPEGPVGTLAARTLATKLRTPRQSVNTMTALFVGAGALVIGPLLAGGTPDPRVVLVGGVLHFAVLFDGSNSYGMDGPALWLEVISGADASVLVRAKALASLLVMAVPAAIVPVLLALLSSGWQWLPAAWLIAAGSLLAAAGVTVANAALAPVALPDSPNPLAAGDTGQGCLAGAILTVGMVVLALVSAPVAVLIALGSTRGVLWATAAALLAPFVGALVLRGGMALARFRLAGREAELIDKVTPAR